MERTTATEGWEDARRRRRVVVACHAVTLAGAALLVLNFVGVVGFHCYLERASLARKARDVLLPVLAAELFSALLTMAAVYVAVELGTNGLVLFGVVLIIFQYLVGELLKSKQRGEQ